MKAIVSEREEQEQTGFPCLMEKTNEDGTMTWIALFLDETNRVVLNCTTSKAVYTEDNVYPVLVCNQIDIKNWKRTDKIVTLSN